MIKKINIASSAISILPIFLIGAFYETIPSFVPIHYAFNGEVDSWGSKNTLWYFVIGSTIINTLLGVLVKHPQNLNYPVKITEKNREKLYAKGSLFVAILRLVVALVIASVILLMSLSVEKIPIFLHLFILSLPILCVLYGIIQMMKNN